MRAGLLRHLVSIQSRTVTPDARGDAIETWVEHAAAWASIEPASGREWFESQQRGAEGAVVITMRYVHGVTSAMRVVHGDAVYAVIGPPIDVGGRGRTLQIMAMIGSGHDG